MGTLALAYGLDLPYQGICEYLGPANGFWIKHDIWKGSDADFKEVGIDVNKRVENWTIADFSYFENERLNEVRSKCKMLIIRIDICLTLLKGKAGSCHTASLHSQLLSRN